MEIISEQPTCWRSFAVKLDKTTYVFSMTQATVFSRFYFNTEIDEELLLWKANKEEYWR